MPFADEHFIGREQELAHLNELFQGSNKVALTGLGGVGKTRLAMRYAYLQKQRYAFILWLSASSKASLDDSLSQHADKLNADPLLKQAEKISFVRAWLEQHKDWLLILDNADNDKEINAKVLQEFLPVSPQGHILFTTQISTADLKFNAAVLEIKCLETEAGGKFL
ncbi:MAG: ATP-binding protein [Methylococcales bacterium]|nr:ATP-binding protein [Methylococcales bacterium]MDD5633573.1 ATP-binding protein [Methylococcales bacterium]